MGKIDEIKIILLDVDGVLTDGSIILKGSEEIKVFNVQDGLGIKLAQRAGIKVFFITNRKSEAVKQRAKELEVDGIYLGIENKSLVFSEIIEKNKVSPQQIAYIGDDLIDIPIMVLAGCPVAVANARDEVKKIACHVTQKRGGHGAVREAIEWILKQNGKWESVVSDYLEEHGYANNYKELEI